MPSARCDATNARRFALLDTPVAHCRAVDVLETLRWGHVGAVLVRDEDNRVVDALAEAQVAGPGMRAPR